MVVRVRRVVAMEAVEGETCGRDDERESNVPDRVSKGTGHCARVERGGVGCGCGKGFIGGVRS